MDETERIFKEAWHEADRRGETGGRVAAGLRAIEEAGLITRTYKTVDQQRREAIEHLTTFLVQRRWASVPANALAEAIVNYPGLVWLDSDKEQLYAQVRKLRKELERPRHSCAE